MENHPHSQGGFITAAVAIDRDKNSHFALRWALENLPLKDNQIILIHVSIPQNLQHEGAVPKVGSSPTLAEMPQFFLPYRGLCARKRIHAKDVILLEPDVATALAEYISKNSLTTIVLGASNRSYITRAFRNLDVPSSLGKSAPDFCSVYAISKTRVLKIKSVSPNTTRQSSHIGYSPDTTSSADIYSWRSTTSETSSIDEGSQRMSIDTTHDMHTVSKNSSPLQSLTNSSEVLQMSPWEMRYGSKNPTPPYSADTSFESIHDMHSVSKNSSPLQSVTNSSEFLQMPPWERRYGCKNPTPPYMADTSYVSMQNTLQMNNLNLHLCNKESVFHSVSASSDLSDLTSFQSSNISFEPLDQPRTSDAARISTSSQAAGELEDELRRLRLELKQITLMYNAACKEAVTAREKVREIGQWKSEEARKLEEVEHSQEAALAIVEREKQKCKAAVEAAHKAQQMAEMESERRKRAELKFKFESQEKQKAMEALSRIEVRYRKYSIDEIEVATNCFSRSRKIGEGGYGSVFKATLSQTSVAIKVLRPDISQGQKQFQRELEVLSNLRHPNMVILVGACPEYGCLVYEYMENGSLEDRLCRKNNTPPIPWSTRFRIAAEIATALLFLHQTRPNPLVHRDLKPGNILLDRNYVSKISDVGLSRLVPPSLADNRTQYQVTAAVGTFCYIDPEYQQTGMLGTKSDIYSFGIILLQIITAMPAMGLTYIVERAIEKGQFTEILDQTVKDWPVEEALSLAKLALKCCELRKRDRPELDSVILPELERLRDLGLENEAKDGFNQMNLQYPSFQESLALSQENRSTNSEMQMENHRKYVSGFSGRTSSRITSETPD
ncbi:Protein kinase protein with adenine nucleotide alpha hydrolase-like domain [Abeliophyllum distichum]|uniref:RING-type E3 ubiquitin transferase n=1 Tax=Abeliophyllum distichum TaxID=126358 RepID=A0ABD1V9N4_9LAMI